MLCCSCIISCQYCCSSLCLKKNYWFFSSLIFFIEQTSVYTPRSSKSSSLLYLRNDLIAVRRRFIVFAEQFFPVSQIINSLIWSLVKESKFTFSFTIPFSDARNSRYTLSDCLYASTDLAERFLVIGM